MFDLFYSFSFSSIAAADGDDKLKTLYFVSMGSELP